jgi:hypothetical protein
MSKTFPGIASHRFANPGQPVMMVLAIKTNSRLVWNFELRGRPPKKYPVLAFSCYQARF